MFYSVSFIDRNSLLKGWKHVVLLNPEDRRETIVVFFIVVFKKNLYSYWSQAPFDKPHPADQHWREQARPQKWLGP